MRLQDIIQQRIEFFHEHLVAVDDVYDKPVRVYIAIALYTDSAAVNKRQKNDAGRTSDEYGISWASIKKDIIFLNGSRERIQGIAAALGVPYCRLFDEPEPDVPIARNLPLLERRLSDSIMGVIREEFLRF